MLPLLHSASLTVDGLDQLSNAGDSPAAAIGALTGLVSAFMVFAVPVLIVMMVLRSRERRRRMQHEVVMKLAEKGQAVPPELFLEQSAQEEKKKKSDLSSGLTMVGAGLGIAVAFYINGDSGMVGWALIPFFVGAARLISWKLEQGQKSL